MLDELSKADPKTVENITLAAFPFYAMLAGMQLDLFSTLRNQPMSSDEIAARIRVDSEKLTSLLFALVAAGLLTFEGQRFSNTQQSDIHLIPSSPNYMVDHACFNVDPLFMTWMLTAAQNTAETIRTGVPQCEYDFSAISSEQLEAGFRATLPIASRAGRELGEMYDFNSHRHLLDVGGGAGGLSIAITKAYPHLEATVVDLEQVLPITRKIVDEAGSMDRVHVRSADVVRDSISGSYDVAVLRAFIQILPPEDIPSVLARVATVITPDGVIYILGHILDDSKASPIEDVWYSMLNINFYDIPGSYTESEYRKWLSGAGFEILERKRLRNGDHVLVGRKIE